METLDFYLNLYSRLQEKDNAFRSIVPRIRGLVKRIGDLQIPLHLKNAKNSKGEKTKGVIVSLTSFPARIDSVWQVVECMKRQSCKPEKILLWLSKDQFTDVRSLPKSLTERQDETFEIRMVDGDLRSHKKYYYAFNEFKNSVVILIDDDIYYPSDMIKKMMTAHCKNPNAVVCRYGYNMRYNGEGNIMPYREWNAINEGGIYSDFFFGSGGGTLFIPEVLYKDCLNKELLWTLTPTADDIWLNAMTRLASLPVVKLDAGLIWSFSKKEESLSSVNLDENQNDRQINAVRKHYLNKEGRDPFEKSQC